MKNLMIVDMQKGLIKENNRFLIDKINNYLNEESFDNVYYTRFYNHEETSHSNILDWHKMTTEEEQNICVDVLENSFVLPKQTYGLHLEHLVYLRNKGIKEVILCGTDIDGCILAIAYNLFDNGIKPIFKWDCCGSANSNKEIKELMKDVIIRNFGKDCII